MEYNNIKYLCKLRTMLILVLDMLSPLSCPRARQLYRIESLHPPRLPLKNKIKVTVSNIVNDVILFLVLK